jgi:hypothetical protein
VAVAVVVAVVVVVGAAVEAAAAVLSNGYHTHKVLREDNPDRR